MERARRRRGQADVDRFEAEDIGFHAQLREKFLEIARAEPRRCRVIEAPSGRKTRSPRRSGRRAPKNGRRSPRIRSNGREGGRATRRRKATVSPRRRIRATLLRCSATSRRKPSFSTPTAPGACRRPGSSAARRESARRRSPGAWRASSRPIPILPRRRCSRRKISPSIRTIPPRGNCRRCPLAISLCCGGNGAKRPRNMRRASRVDDVRHAIHLFEQAAGEGGWRMVIIDSADDFNLNSANALLKLIEEPPPRCLFLLIAHQPGPPPADHHVAVPDADAAKPRAAGDSTPPCAKRSTPRGKRRPSPPSPKPAPARKGPCDEALRLLRGRRERGGRSDGAGSGATCRVSNGGSPTASPIRVSGRGGETEFEAFLRADLRLARRIAAPQSGAWPARLGALCGGLGIPGARDARPGDLQSGQEGFRDASCSPRLAEAERAARAATRLNGAHHPSSRTLEVVC